MAKFCGKCGSRLDETTGLCPNCTVGNLCRESEKQATPPTAYSLDQPLQKKATKKQRKTVQKARRRAKRSGWSKGKRIWRRIVTVILILLGLAILFASTVGMLVYCGVIDIPLVEELGETLDLKQPQKEAQLASKEELAESYREILEETKALEKAYVDTDGFVDADEVNDLLSSVSEHYASLYRKTRYHRSETLRGQH